LIATRLTIVRFADTSILLYTISRDRQEQEKARRANEILSSRDIGLSVQVLQEFYFPREGPEPLSGGTLRTARGGTLTS
jgi:predicted nucleic acid-binding protein